MKITSNIPSVGTGADAGRARPATQASRPAGTSEAAQVELSALSSQLQGTGQDAPVVDVSRVAEIKQAIAEGRFQINPERIADGLLESTRQLLGKR